MPTQSPGWHAFQILACASYLHRLHQAEQTVARLRTEQELSSMREELLQQQVRIASKLFMGIRLPQNTEVVWA